MRQIDFRAEQFCVLCRAFFPTCSVVFGNMGVALADLGEIGIAEMYPACNGPDKMLMVLHHGMLFTPAYTGYDVGKFTEALKRFNRSPSEARSYYANLNKEAEIAMKRRRASRIKTYY